MSDSHLKIAYITAGAGGMYCGSCMHDNTLARALSKAGVDVQLIPTYTPIRTDEEDVSIDRVFLSGINVYLQQKIPLFRYLPELFDRLFDRRWLIRWATARAVDVGPKQLGALTVSMLRGASGYQRKEVRKLCRWLASSVRPDIVNLTNMLIAGCAPALKRELGVPLLVTLQGDDVFLEGLVEPYKTRAFEQIRRVAEDVDGFVVHSRYYADFMADYFDVPPEKFHVTPLAIDTSDYAAFAACDRAHTNDHPPTVGYLARLAPEKGLHVLVDAFLELRRRPGMERARLKIAGWLGASHREYAEREFDKLRSAALGDAFSYEGEVNRHGKLTFLDEIDVLSVPTTYRDPKGLFVLEALAAGIPVVQPRHGAFPELLAAVGGGRLVRPEDPQHLADALYELLTDHEARTKLGRAGCQAVHAKFGAESMARAMIDIYSQFLEQRWEAKNEQVPSTSE